MKKYSCIFPISVFILGLNNAQIMYFYIKKFYASKFVYL